MPTLDESRDDPANGTPRHIQLGSHLSDGHPHVCEVFERTEAVKDDSPLLVTIPSAPGTLIHAELPDNPLPSLRPRPRPEILTRKQLQTGLGCASEISRPDSLVLSRWHDLKSIISTQAKVL